MAEPKDSPSVTLSHAQLQELLVNMAREIRRPADPTPEQAAVIEQNRKDRMENALVQKQIAENRRWNQEHGCLHMRKNGHTTAVFVQGYGFMICQHCQALIYPEGAVGVPAGIYNTELFNRLFLLSQANESMA